MASWRRAGGSCGIPPAGARLALCRCHAQGPATATPPGALGRGPACAAWTGGRVQVLRGTAFSFPDIGALSAQDTAKALQDPARAAGVIFKPAALDEVFRLTKGYPYFVQEWGYQAWNWADSSPITVQVIHDATATVVSRLDQNFFRVRYDRLTPAEKNFLRAMAELGPGPQRTGDIADTLKVKVTSLGPVRAKLIKKGMIYSPAHGEMAFTVPLFNELMIRAIPKFKRG